MRRKITCFCENSFEVEVPEEVDLENNREYFDQILNGSFFSYLCAACGKNLKPEFPVTVNWPSQKSRFEVIPELERGEFYRRKKTSSEKDAPPKETIIGYPELSDRIAVIRDGLEPVAVEAIKYYLQLKAEEQYPEDEPVIWYFSSNKDAASNGENGFLEFHIHGIKDNEVAVMKVPLSFYAKTHDDYKNNPKKEIFSILKFGNYLSVKNTMRHEVLK